MGGARAEFWKPREREKTRAEPESIRKRFCPRVVGESKLRKLPEERALFHLRAAEAAVAVAAAGAEFNHIFNPRG